LGWIRFANGDARSLLKALELAVETSDGILRIDAAIAEDSIQQRAVLYDQEGDVYFDTISASIKSIRGSDPDAAPSWLARMLYAGEDPRFILRRLPILAGEDVGLADPQAVGAASACAAAFDRVGLPEGRYPLAQATKFARDVDTPPPGPHPKSLSGLREALLTPLLSALGAGAGGCRGAAASRRVGRRNIEGNCSMPVERLR